MKRKIASVSGAILIGCLILLVSVYRSTNNVPQSLAVANLQFEVQSQLSSESSVPKVDYYLVYPGILPDHPLYKIKMIRDRIWLWLTTDVLDKSELLLLYADKRLGAGKVLVEGNKVDLGIATLWKGEKYLERAVDAILAAKEKGLGVNTIAEKIKNSSLKHEEVLLGLKEKVNGEGKTALGEIIEYLQEIQKKTNSF